MFMFEKLYENDFKIGYLYYLDLVQLDGIMCYPGQVINLKLRKLNVNL